MNRHDFLSRPAISRAPEALLVLALTSLLLLPLAVPPVAQAAGGAPSQPAPAAPPPQTPEQLARDHYNNGLRMRDRAWKLEEKVAEADDEAKREKLLKKVDKQFEAAAREFRQAVANDGRLFEAWSSLGYALRRLGDYEESLNAYNRALGIEPGYTEAIEYRAEAYLGLGRIDEAKEAYMILFNHDRKRAEELLTAMEQWVEEHRKDPGGMDAGKVEDLAGWVEQRSQVATQTSALYPSEGAGHADRSW